MDIETTIDDRIYSLSKKSLHEKIKHDFIGLDTKYQVFSGEFIKRIYLDSTASSLMMGAAYRAATEF